MDNGDELISIDEMWQMLRDAGIERSSLESVKKWRLDYGVELVQAVRRSQVEEAIDSVMRKGRHAK